MFESEFRDKRINISYSISLDALYYRTYPRDSHDFSISHNFIFSMTDIKVYFHIFSVEIYEFKRQNKISPKHDLNLIMDLYVENCDINPAHSPHLGGFIFKHTTFKIIEYTLEDNRVSHRTLHEFRISNNQPSETLNRLDFKADTQYGFSLFDDINQRVIDHKDENYNVNIDFTLRFYYTTDKYSNLDVKHPWK